ncbi:hypothetical protein ACFFRR_003190 [Megaselia abdita]
MCAFFYYFVEENNQEEEEAEEKEAPAPKGRGRPKGTGSAVAKKKPSDLPKKGRGRPPKKDRGRGKPPKGDDDDSVPSGPPKPRGRPSKPKSDAVEVSSESKKPRGRPSKAKVEDEEEEDEEDEEPTSNGENHSPSASKGRGKPKNSKSPSKTVAPQSAKGRGRPPKVQSPQVTEELIDENDLSFKRRMFSNILAFSKQKHDEYEAAHKKRGRGRPRKTHGKKREERVIVEEIHLPKVEKELIDVEIDSPEEEYELLEVVDEPEGVLSDNIFQNFLSIKIKSKRGEVPKPYVLQDVIEEDKKSGKAYQDDVTEYSSPVKQEIPEVFQFPAGRGRPRKQTISMQCTSTPKPHLPSKNYNLNTCALTPITQEEPPVQSKTPPKASFSYLLRSPESSYADSFIDEDSTLALKDLKRKSPLPRKTWNRKLPPTDTQDSKKIKIESEIPQRKTLNRKPETIRPSLENALEKLLEDQTDNDDDLNEKLSKALEDNRNKQSQKENRMSFLTKALENRRGEIQKEIELNKPRGRGRPKGSKKCIPKTVVTVLTADDDFQGEKVVNICENIKQEIKTEVKHESLGKLVTTHSPPKILQRKNFVRSLSPAKELPRPIKQEIRGSLSELLKKKARKTKIIVEEETSHAQPSETIAEDEFVAMVFLDFD